MKYSIRLPILIALISLVVISAILTAGILYTKFNEKTILQITNNLNNALQECKSNLSETISHIQKINDYVSIDKTIIASLQDDNQDVINQIKTINNLKSEYGKLFNIFLKDNLTGSSLSFFVDQSMPMGKNVSDCTKVENFAANSLNFYNDTGLADEEWYQATIEKKDGMHFFRKGENNSIVFFAQLIKNNLKYGDENLGVNVIGIDLKQVLSSFKNISNGIAINTFILDRNNKVICENETIESEIFLQDLIKAYEVSPKQGGASFLGVDLNHKKYMLKIHGMEFGMKLLAVVSESDVLVEIKEISQYVFLVTLLTLVVVIFIAIYLSESLSHPVKKLAGVMMRFEENLDAPMIENSSSLIEIDSLYHSYGKMKERIKGLLTEAKAFGVKEKELEVKMLQAQIKPHFLYNALDSIAWIALKRKEHDIADMITALSEGFRYTIKAVDNFISVKDEIEFIKSYLRLQKLRYGDKFNFKIDIDKSIEKLLIPKFILQPLVENSIIHGFGRKAKKTTITISAKPEGAIVKFFVKDNGIGCNIDRLNRYLEGDTHVFTEEKIGIWNVHKRIKIKYGEDYGLYYVNNEEGGLTAIVEIPIFYCESEYEESEREDWRRT